MNDVEEITPDALLRDGWRQNNRQFEKRCGIFVYPFRSPVLVTVRNKTARGVSDMKDLRDLYRLLNGEKK